MGKKKFYVVWKGREVGVFATWDLCKKQVHGFEGAQYKSFDTEIEAKNAFSLSYQVHSSKKELRAPSVKAKQNVGSPIQDSLAVDAACSGNPGDMEYRGVYVQSGKEVFKKGVYKHATNNVGEFLALVHGLAFLKQHNSAIPLYSDSVNAIKWVQKKQCKTKLERNVVNEQVFDLIARAEKWLHENSYTTQILKWETDAWGEIPADFGRK
jgi:ribonuclease HI